MFRIISASVTPFDDHGRVDSASAVRLYEWGLQCGLDGFFVGGNMGEWLCLTDEMLESLAATASETLEGRARLILGVHDTSRTRVLRKIERLSRFRHTHWAALFPPTPGGIPDPVAYVHDLADHCDRPFFLYYLPAYNGIELQASQFEALLSHPNVAGVKNSAGRMRVRKELLLLKRRVDFELYEGEEWAVDEALTLGCDGAIVGFGSMGGRILRAMADAGSRGDFTRVREVSAALVDIMHKVYGNPPGHPCAGQKWGLVKMGILAHGTTLVESQRALPADTRSAVEVCVKRHPEWFAAG